MTTLPAPDLTTDLANVIRRCLLEHVGSTTTKFEMQRVLDRFAKRDALRANEDLEAMEQLAAQRQYISAEMREAIRLDSLQRDIIDGVPSPF